MRTERGSRPFIGHYSVGANGMDFYWGILNSEIPWRLVLVFCMVLNGGLSFQDQKETKVYNNICLYLIVYGQLIQKKLGFRVDGNWTQLLSVLTHMQCCFL